MDFSDILSNLWNKFSKPIPNILLGLVILFLSPLDWETRWVGWIFIALGVSGILEYIWKFIKEKYRQRKERRNLIKTLAELQPYELAFLKVLLSHNQRTFDRDDIRFFLEPPQQNKMSDERAIEILFEHQKAIVCRLENLSIISEFINSYYTYEIHGWYWDILKKQHKDIFNKRELYFRDFK